MIENDYIKELFSKSLENQTAPVRPEVWNGLQAKMAAAGIASAAATKGLSVLAKWLIGSAAVTGTAVITTIAVMSAGEDKQPENKPAETEQVAQQPSVETIGSNEQPQTAEIQYNNSESGSERIETPTPATTGVRSEPLPEIVPTNPSDRRQPLAGKPENPSQPAVATPQPEVREPEETHVSQPLVMEKEPAAAVNEGNDPNFKAPKLHFPNVFTPNGDHANDEYFIDFDNVSAVKIAIMDQKGENVFVTEDRNFRWDGTFQGSGDPVPNGTYACIVIYRDLAGKSHKEITLIDIRR